MKRLKHYIRDRYNAFNKWSNNKVTFDWNIPIWPGMWFHFSWIDDHIRIGVIKIKQ